MLNVPTTDLGRSAKPVLFLVVAGAEDHELGHFDTFEDGLAGALHTGSIQGGNRPSSTLINIKICSRRRSSRHVPQGTDISLCSLRPNP